MQSAFLPGVSRAVTIALIWLVSVAMALPKVTYIQFSGGCTWSVDRAEWLGFLVPAFLVYYVAPLLCIAAHCAAIVLRLRRCFPATGGGVGRGGGGCGGRLPSADRRNKKATALLVASTLAFAVSWLPYYALEFVNVVSPHVCSAASPTGALRSCGSSSSSANASSLRPSLPPEPGTRGVSLLWEVASLTAILLVCLAPCWNPPLYFLLSRPAVRELRRLLPPWLRCRRHQGLGGGGDDNGDGKGGKAARSGRVAPDLPLPGPRPLPRLPQ